MSTQKFDDTHNLVAFLSKPAESEGFDQIIDFLNANPIKYALTVNPTIYASCIEQFRATAKVITVNGEVQLQSLVDRKKVIVTESIAFFFPQWKFLIHTILHCLSAKTTAWNEFSGTMASAIICLTTNQKFNFSKYIFNNMVKNLDNVNTFFMYPRFVQVFLEQQVGDMSNHNRIFVTPSLTKKVFRNMRRAGKGFSRRETPLFPTMMVQAQEEIGEGLTTPTDPHHTPIFTQPSTSQPQKKQKSRKPKRQDTEVPQPSGPTTNVAYEAINQENVSKHSNDPLLSGEDRLKLKELMELCTNLQERVLDLETTKTTQAQEIASLKRRVKKMERRNRSRTYRLKRLYKVGLTARVESSFSEDSLGEEDASKQGRKIHDIDADEDITLENVHDAEMFRVSDLAGEEVFVDQEVLIEKVVSTAEVTTAGIEVTTASTTTITIDEITLAQALVEIKISKPKANEIVKVQDKGKGIMIEEPLKMKKKDKISFDAQEAIRLQAEFDDEERLAREKDEANIALTEEWNDIQAKVETDYELAKRLQAQEQEGLTVAEKEKLFQQLLEQRRKHFAAKRAEEKRNRPPTRAQQRSFMCSYLKNMKGWKLKDLKNKSFADIQKLFEKAMKRVNTFADYRAELVEEGLKKEDAEIVQERSTKRAGDELEQENAKKLKDDDDQEVAKMQDVTFRNF
ncbi:hypothetical protein Tco_0780067, partial [Tanacetum coccineum]